MRCGAKVFFRVVATACLLSAAGCATAAGRGAAALAESKLLVRDERVCRGRAVAGGAELETRRGLVMGSMLAGPRPVSQGTIRRIEIRGLRRTEEGSARGLLQSAVGEPLEVGKLQSDIRRLWENLDLDDIFVADEQLPDGVALVFALSESPEAGEIVLSGESVFSPRQIQDIIGIRRGTVLRPEVLTRVAGRLADRYRRFGHRRAEVRLRAAPAGEGILDLCLEIHEGPETVVESLVFEGSKNLSRPVLLDCLSGADLAEGRVYRGNLDQELMLLQACYYDHGMIDTRVSDPRVEEAPGRGAVTVTFSIQEGEVYRFGNIGFDGELCAEAGEYRKLLAFAAGETFSRRRIQESIEAMQKFNREHGCPDADVLPETNIRQDSLSIDLVFRIERPHRGGQP